MRTITIPASEYQELRKKAENNELVKELVQGLEDVKAGRIKPWKPKN
jgi:hypothetical protein